MTLDRSGDAAAGEDRLDRSRNGPGSALEVALRARRDAGHKLLVPYVTGGLGDDWLDVVRAVAAAGADAVEVGLPFSDPVMDGPVIQEASARALARGATPAGLVAALARADAGVPLVVDNTVASPYLCRPLEHGAAVVVHSATRYLGGHSDVVGGLALFADPERHAAAWKALIELGASPDPFAAWLVLRGVKTLALRMRAHGANARRLAELLDAHPKVARVYWPGLPGHPTARLAAKLLDGDPGMLSFDLEGGRAAGRRFIEATRVARLAPSLGSVETLVSHPASTTHRQFAPDALAAAGIGEGMVRVSVGLEDGDDLAEDFRQALEVV